MTNPELDQLLKSAPAPERPPEFWEALPKRISAKLHWQPRASRGVNLPPRFGWGLVWGVPGAAVLLLLGFLWGNWQGTKQPGALLQNEKVLREVLATFPNQVRAIIQDENGLQISLAEEANIPQSQPLWIKVCGPRGCQEIVTFSGQQVRVNGELWDVLADGAGNVILAGQTLIWTSQSHTASAGGYRIEIRSVEVSS